MSARLGKLRPSFSANNRHRSPTMNPFSLCLQLPSNSAISTQQKTLLLLCTQWSRLRGRAVTPKLHVENIPHSYGSGPVCSIFLLFSGQHQPQPPAKASQLYSVGQGGTALAARYETSAPCIRMEMEECRM